MEGATPQRGGELVRTYGRTSYSPPVPHQRPKKGGRSLHLRWPRTGTAGAPAGPEPQASQPHKEAPPRTSKRLFSAPTPHCLMCACGSAGIAAVPHGFRSSFRDWAAEERTDRSREVIEAALAHVVQNRVEAPYARSDLFERRRILMDDWSRYLAQGTGENPEPAR